MQKTRLQGEEVPPAPTKRERSDESLGGVGQEKQKAKYAEVTVAQEFKLAIVNRADKMDWRLGEEGAEEIKENLHVFIEEELEEGGEDPQLEDSGIIRGHLLLNCTKSRSKLWLGNAIKKLKWINPNWDLVPVADLPDWLLIGFFCCTQEEVRIIDTTKMYNQQQVEVEVAWKRCHHPPQIYTRVNKMESAAFDCDCDCGGEA